MTWQPVSIMTADAAAPEHLQVSNAALVERAAELARDRREIDDRIAKLGEADLSPKTLKAMDAVREAKIVSWQVESTLRSVA